MSYYGSGYSQGVGGQLDPVDSSPQGAPIPGNFFMPGTSSGQNLNSTQTAGVKSAADQLSPNPLLAAGTPNQAGHYESYQNALGSVPSWASQYITQNADVMAGYDPAQINYLQRNNTAAQNQAGYIMGNGNQAFTPSSGQMNDAYMGTAPTLGALNKQYGSNFDPTQLTGLWNGSLLGTQNTLQGQGYGLGNIGNYYQNNILNPYPNFDNNGYTPPPGAFMINGTNLPQSDFTSLDASGGKGVIGGVNFNVNAGPTPSGRPNSTYNMNYLNPGLNWPGISNQTNPGYGAATRPSTYSGPASPINARSYQGAY